MSSLLIVAHTGYDESSPPQLYNSILPWQLCNALFLNEKLRHSMPRPTRANSAKELLRAFQKRVDTMAWATCPNYQWKPTVFCWSRKFRPHWTTYGRISLRWGRSRGRTTRFWT